jgi:predicted transcriptional regulator
VKWEGETAMEKRLLELAVEIVQAQASMAKMTGEEIESLLIKTHNALFKMHQAEKDGRPVPFDGPEQEQTGAASAFPERLDPRSSIQEEKVICLECGVEFRQLTANHLKTHGLTPREYKRKWGFPLKQPLAARVLTKLRSRSAKKRGLPQKLQQYLDDQRLKKGASVVGSEQAEGAAHPRRRTVRRRSA